VTQGRIRRGGQTSDGAACPVSLHDPDARRSARAASTNLVSDHVPLDASYYASPLGLEQHSACIEAEAGHGQRDLVLGGKGAGIGPGACLTQEQ
jgi:hypothetical protein